jgi:purine catabolism regulator
MPLSLASLVRHPALGLTVLAGADALDRDIAWVHTSELVDPTPYLEPGALLLTVGLWVQPDMRMEQYVDRLDKAGVVGLCFGIKPTHDAVPGSLVAAAADRGLPLIAVPENVPFIAVSRAVWEALAADQYAEVTRTAQDHHDLTRAAVSSGAAGLIRALAARLGGWAVLLDPAGTVRQAAPAGAARQGPWLARELERLRDVNNPVSATLSIDGEQIVVQSLRPERRTRGFLAIGTAARPTAEQRNVVSTAVSLLTLMLAQAGALRAAEAHLRTTIFDLLVGGDPDRAGRLATDLWGGLPREPVRLLLVDGTAAARADLLEIVDAAATADGERLFYATVADRAVVVYAATGHLRDRVLAVARTCPPLTAGESADAAIADLARAQREADQAVRAGLRAGRRHTAFAEIGASGLFALLASPPARAFAESLLRPLLDHDAAGRGDLIRSLGAWLEHNGQWDAAAAALGVHRHTLRHRMRRVEELLGRDLDATAVRMELWAAVQLLES